MWICKLRFYRYSNWSIGSLAPKQRKTLSEFGIKALIGGTVASLLSATIAGMIIG